jgi:predicted nucleic acid-binding protein
MAAFIDTNVLMHCTDAGGPGKPKRARSRVERLSAAGETVASTQALIELHHVLTRRQMTPPATAQALVMACTAGPVIDSDLALVGAAIDNPVAHQLAIRDAMLVQAALRADAHTLYSENFSHRRRFGPLAVVNPFLA